MMRMGRALTVLCLLLSLATATPVPAAEIKILSGSAIENGNGRTHSEIRASFPA
jgi:hypothetical protein